MTDALTCYPSGCPGCVHRTDRGCELMQLLDTHGVITLKGGGSPRHEHPIDGFATA